MKAAVVHSFGSSPRYADFPDPTVAEGEHLIEVRAAGVHPVVRALASGTHYGSDSEVPLVPGVDGVGVTPDGTHVYFGFLRPPFGTLAERAAAPAQMCMPVPDWLDDVTVAAIMNPGLSAWLALRWRSQFVAGETVLVNGATGAAGQLAVQSARALGAGRIIATGRNPDVLARLESLGADAVVPIDDNLAAAVASAADGRIDVIIDYLWGAPTEAILSAVTRTGRTHHAARVRLIEVGQSAGATITLPAALLRSSSVEIYGTGMGTIPNDVIIAEVPGFIEQVVRGALTITPEVVPLAEIADLWARGDTDGRRAVVVP